MPRISLLLLALVLFVSPGTAADDKFTPLFNGTDTTGWTFTLRPPKEKPDAKPDPKDTWSVKDGVLVCTGQPNGYIATAAEYSNYTLRLKWRYPAGTAKPNSGVLLHCASEDRVWPTCLEAQLKAGFAGDIWLNPDADGKLPSIQHDRPDKADRSKRHFLRLEPKAGFEKPLGEWNEYEIVCSGGDLKLKVNGELANEAKGGSLVKGRIALQSEGSAVEFKEIEIQLAK
jgi:hypothetical protein